MATVVNVPADRRNEEVGNALVDAINQISNARQKKQMETNNQTALQAIVKAKDWNEGFDALMANADPSTLSNPQQLAAFLGVVGAVHRGSQPQTPTDINKIVASLQASMSRIQSAESIAQAARDVTQSEGKLNRQQRVEQPAVQAQAKGLGDIIAQVHAAGKSAANVTNVLDVTDQLVDKARTGVLAPLTSKIQSGLAQFGLDDPTVNKILVGDPAAMAGLAGQSGKLILENIGGSLGVGFSNADRDLIASIGPSISNTREGNKLLSVVMRAGANRAKEMDRVVTEMESSGASQVQISAKINEMRQTSIIDEATKKKMEEMTNAAPDLNTPETSTPQDDTRANAMPSIDYSKLKPGDRIPMPGGGTMIWNGTPQVPKG